MTTITAPLTNITLQGRVPDVVRSCIVQQPSLPPDPGETPPGPITGEGIYTPVAPGVTYEALPTVSIVDTSPDQMIGCIIDTADNPQGRLNALFPSAIDGDGVIERSTNDIWVFDGATWNNVGPTPGPTIVTATVIPPWNEIVIYDARVRTRLEVNGLAYALELLTEPAPYGITLNLTVQTSQALVRVPAADQSFAVQLPAVSSGGPVLPPAAATTLAALIPQVSSGAFVAVPQADISFGASVVPYVGTGATVVQLPDASTSLLALPPAVTSVASVAVPVADTTFIVGTALIYAYDADALAYINAVENTDNQELEYAIRAAINDFIVGCKSDGVWNAIKASCILAGARTRLGSLTPLKGGAPSSVNFVDGDYDRKTGLLGDGASKWLNTNRNNNTDPQNSLHLAVWVSTATTSGASDYPVYIGYDATGASKTGLSHIGRLNNNSADLYTRARMLAASGESDTISGQGSATGFIALNRASSTAYTARAGQANTVFTRTSATAQSGTIGVLYGQLSGSYSNARVAFYSIGESLDLALLDARVTQLMADIDAAI